MTEIQPEQNLRNRIAELEMANCMLTDFAAVISHDMRSGLRRLWSYAESLAVLPTLNSHARTRDCLHVIIASARRMQFLVDGALESPGSSAADTGESPFDESGEDDPDSLQRQFEELQQANRELSDFAGAIARGLRAPLGQILSAARDLTALRPIILNPVSLEMAGYILTAAEQMQRLIEDYLSFANAERHTIQRSRVSLESLVQLVRHELEPMCAGRNVYWQIAPLPEVEADPSMLRQVLVNLLGNSLKYTQKCRDAVIEVGVRPDPNEHIIFIRDNGIGFDLDSARKLFQKFGRLHYDETYPGAGIGLLIVKYIIQRHQGRVWAEGAPGGGATFCFALPGAA
jgi:light-regulated signal transduction histidine kinase (bacteriophytochrome)